VAVIKGQLMFMHKTCPLIGSPALYNLGTQIPQFHNQIKYFFLLFIGSVCLPSSV